MGIRWIDKELRSINLPKRKLVSLVKKLEACAKTMEELNLRVYAVDGRANILHLSRPDHDSFGKPDTGAVIADVEGCVFDGGGW